MEGDAVDRIPPKKSYPNLQLEALVTRVSPTHPSYETIVSDLGKRKIGYFGEERASYFLLFYQVTLVSFFMDYD